MVKKILVIMLMLLSFSGMADASSVPNWYWLYSDDTMTTYIDNAHVLKDDYCAIVWTKCIFRSGPYNGDVLYMQWYITRDGKISWIYGKERKADGRITYHYPDSNYSDKSVTESPKFQKLYDLIWPSSQA